jgi:HPr kinase/phosphorylase
MTTTVHGALLDVHEVGIVLVGPSGIGKSECALELIRRGHRLVADDVVEVRVQGEALLGSAPERIRHFMEIRGVGIFYVPDHYGVESVRAQMSIDLVIRLERWREGASYERVGLERPEAEIAGQPRPVLTLPARPGGSMATVVEVAAREHRQRGAGIHAARSLDARLREEMRRP